MTFQDKLKGLRKENNLSQVELAEKLNVSRSVVAKWETGIRLPKGELLDSLAEVLGVEADELFDDKPSQEVIVKKTSVISRQLKIIIVSISVIVSLIISLIIVLLSFNKPQKPTIVIHDNFNLLFEPIGNKYKEGDIIEIKVIALSGPRQGVFYNDTYINTTICSEDFSYCSAYIKMPSTSLNLYITRNGLTGESYYDYSPETWRLASKSDRERLFNSFINIYSMNLLTKNDILNYLGVPERIENTVLTTYPTQDGGSIFYYNLTDIESNKYIVIQFNGQNKITSYKVQKD